MHVLAAAGETIVIKLPYDRPPLSLNRHNHHMKEARERKAIKTDVGWLLRHHKVPKGRRFVMVTLLWVVQPNRRRDTDNPMPTLKPMIDALVEYGLVPDDSSEYVSSGVSIQVPGEGDSRGLYLLLDLDDEPSVTAGTKALR